MRNFTGDFEKVVWKYALTLWSFVFEPSHPQFTVELSSSDLVADLRAEVTHISEQFQQQQHQQQQQQACPEQEDAPSQKQPPAMGFAGLTGALSASSLQGQRPVRMISVGHELTPDLDEKNLKEMGFCDLQVSMTC